MGRKRSLASSGRGLRTSKRSLIASVGKGGKDILKTTREVKLFVTVELLTLLMVVVLAYNLIGPHVVNGKLEIISENFSVLNLVGFVCAFVAFILLYVGIAIRDKKMRAVHNDFSGVVFGAGKKKVTEVNVGVIFLWLAEIIFVLIIALSIYVYLDPDINILPSGIPWYSKLTAFVAFVLFCLYMFSRTKTFREQVYGIGFLAPRIKPKHEIVRRITNTRTGVIRVKGRSNNHLHFKSRRGR